MLGQFLRALVNACAQTGQVRRPQGGGFNHLGAQHRNAQQVGLELHQQVVHTGPAVDAQLGDWLGGIPVHGLQQRGTLKRNAFQGGAGNVGHGGAARQAHHRAACIGLPVGRTQAGEGGYQHHAAGVGHALGQGLHIGAFVKGAQAIAQPLHHRTANEDRAFQGIGGGAVGLGGTGGDEPVVAGLELVSGVHQHEAAGAIGVFGLTGLETGLAKQGALLVTRHPADGQFMAQPLRLGAAKVTGRGMHLGQHRFGNIQQLEQLVVPLVAVDVEQHGAGRVADIGGMHRAAGELPHQPAVHRAKGQFTACRHVAGTRHVVQNPLQFGGRKIGINQEPGFLLHQGRCTRFAQTQALGLGASVLPNNGVVNGLAGIAPPDHRGFALVGDAQRRHLGRADAGLLQGLAGCSELAGPDFLRVVLDPARVWVDLPKLLLRHGQHRAVGLEDDAAGAGGALVEGEDVGHGGPL